jgi:hypothetical protein
MLRGGIFVSRKPKVAPEEKIAAVETYLRGEQELRMLFRNMAKQNNVAECG